MTTDGSFCILAYSVRIGIIRVGQCLTYPYIVSVLERGDYLPMAEEAPIRRLAKPVRRDVRRRLRAVVQRARLLASVEPGFQDQLNSLRIGREVMETLGFPGAVSEGRRGAAQMPAAKSRDQPAPFKMLRRQIRSDVAVLLDEIRLLRQLDSDFANELDRYHLTEAVQELERARASAQR